MDETIEDIRKRVAQAQKDYRGNVQRLEALLLLERGFIASEPTSEDVVVLCSGGLDSSVMMSIVIDEWNVKVHPLFIKRGARAEKYEEQAFDFFVDFYRKRFPENIGEAAKLAYEVPPKQFKEHFPKELALTVGHPLRNSTMQNLAVMYAVALNGKHGLDIRTVFSGSVEEDNTEPELGLLSLRSQTLNTCIHLGDWRWQITSPLTDYELKKGRDALNKKDLIEYAIANNIPLDKTRTCFSADEIADGTCFACMKRLRAFEAAGVKDPILYKGGK